MARLPAALLALMAVASAGCIGAWDAPTVTDAPRGFRSPLPLPQDALGGEPVIAVLDDGTVFVTAATHGSEGPNQLEGAAWLWRSRDGGATWDVLRDPHHDAGAPATPGGGVYSGDSDVTSSPDGWVYYSDWWAFAGPVVGPVGNFLVERSADGGESWESAPVTIPQPTRVDRQWLVAGADGFVGLFYYARGAPPAGAEPDELSRALVAVLSTDHGATWSAPVTVVPAEAGVVPMISKPRALADGTLVMAYGVLPRMPDDEWGWTEPSEVRVAVSTDDAASWTHHRVADVPGGFDNIWAVQADVDDTGRIVVAWAARSGADVLVHVSESTDAGATWSPPAALATQGTHVVPWVAAAADGRAAVAWYGSDATGDPREAPPGTQWFPFVAERTGAGSPFHVTRVTDDPALVGPLCVHGAACGVPPPGEHAELMDFLAVEYGPDGRLHHAFARSDTVTGAEFRAWVHHAVRDAR